MKNCSLWIVSAIFISNYSYSSAINLEPTEINQKWRVVVDSQTRWGFVLNQLKSFNISSFGPPSQSSIKTKYICIYWIYIHHFQMLRKPLHLHTPTFLNIFVIFRKLKACFFAIAVGKLEIDEILTK